MIIDPEQPEWYNRIVRSQRELYKETGKNRRYVKRARKLGASNREIATALGISEDAPVLSE